MIVLDTNVVSELFRRRPEPAVITWIEHAGNDLAITTVTMSEILAGLWAMPEGSRRSDLIGSVTSTLEKFKRSRAILSFDEGAAERYAEVWSVRRRAGRPISTADAQIAAVCLSLGATLATRNTRDFLGTGVELIDPWTAS